MQESEQVKGDWLWVNEYDVADYIKIGPAMPDGKETGVARFTSFAVSVIAF
jgi:hypothetical protein